jgi:hypothetical protein
MFLPAGCRSLCRPLHHAESVWCARLNTIAQVFLGGVNRVGGPENFRGARIPRLQSFADRRWATSADGRDLAADNGSTPGVRAARLSSMKYPQPMESGSGSVAGTRPLCAEMRLVIAPTAAPGLRQQTSKEIAGWSHDQVRSRLSVSSHISCRSTRSCLHPNPLRICLFQPTRGCPGFFLIGPFAARADVRRSGEA